MTYFLYSIFDHASPRKRVEEKCNDMALPILEHVIKLILYTPTPEYGDLEDSPDYFSGKATDKLIRHWENEILNFMRYDAMVLKGGKFSYNWFFEPLTPYNEPQIEKWVDNIIEQEGDLVPNDVLVSELISTLYYFRDNLLELHHINKRVLTRAETLTILRDAIKY